MTQSLLNVDMVLLIIYLLNNGKSKANNKKIDKLLERFDALWLEDNFSAGKEVFHEWICSRFKKTK